MRESVIKDVAQKIHSINFFFLLFVSFIIQFKAHLIELMSYKIYSQKKKETTTAQYMHM